MGKENSQIGLFSTVIDISSLLSPFGKRAARKTAQLTASKRQSDVLARRKVHRHIDLIVQNVEPPKRTIPSANSEVKDTVAS